MQIPEKPPLLVTPTADRLPEDPLPEAAESIGTQLQDDVRDTLHLTEKGSEYRNAVQYAQMRPDVRSDRIAQLKRQLAEGSYRIQGDRIAADMMTETLENNTVLTHIDINS